MKQLSGKTLAKQVRELGLRSPEPTLSGSSVFSALKGGVKGPQSNLTHWISCAICIGKFWVWLRDSASRRMSRKSYAPAFTGSSMHKKRRKIKPSI